MNRPDPPTLPASSSESAPSSRRATAQPAPGPLSPEFLFAGGGELGGLMRAFDWSRSPLGPVETWPQSLRTCVRIILTSRQPMFVWWGDELINLYNDAYKSIVGGKHPVALGQPARLVWREIWDQIAPRVASAMRNNEGTYDEALLLIMERYGYREETYYTFSYSPVPNDRGGTGGIICANTDHTSLVIGERQVALLRELAARTADARTAEDACRLSALALETNPRDIPFALLYTETEPAGPLHLAGAVGFEPGHPASPAQLPAGDHLWPITAALQSHEIQLVCDLHDRFSPLPQGAWRESPHSAAVVPLSTSGSVGKSGVVIVGLNPFRLPDDNYSGFLTLVAGQIAAAIANAEAWEQERRRAEALTQLDREKTIFFSNVSHEFRTPLTLMLGPLEDVLSRRDQNIPPHDLVQIETVHRNGLRLLKLVNTLLDFSRIEAGRIQALYRPVDLSARTAELASVFRSAMDRAGLAYRIDCEPLPEPVFVDLDMWEKIVLNLLSNAFKFTLQGTVELALRSVAEPASPGYAELSVRDSGTGIPESELPRVFERFHRIEGAPGRTHEGTGIGLALVDELVRLHGGSVKVDSKLGGGTTFTVRIPYGSAHLAAERIAAASQRADITLGAAPYVQEALRWLPGEDASEEPLVKDLANEDLGVLLDPKTQEKRAHILLADDNRDMREYVQRLLSRKFTVTVVPDGEQALAAARENPPDLVLTDVMMPRMNGFELLRALRSDPATAAIPILMLSARAGEEAESEGLEAGADDYLVKPFTARELLARVTSHISMQRLRSELTSKERELRTKAERAEQQYRTILESISEGFVFVDRDWRVRYANHQVGALGAFDPVKIIGQSLWDIAPGLELTSFGRAFQQAMDTNQVTRCEDFYQPSQRWIHATAYPAPDGLSLFGQDVTESRIQQQKLLVSEKLAATGRLAATIAHEINNPLESVLNLIYLARTSRTEIANIRDYLETAEKELTRVSHIARHTLGFYRETSVPVDVNLPALIEEVLTVYDSRLRASAIEILRDFSIVPNIRALRGELHQVFSNLISNSIDAMRDGGRLSVSIRPAPLPEAGVVVAIADTGCGIPQENIPRLFEPFFTTKPSAGTGLGLWVVRQFVTSWKGAIDVTSDITRQRHGTTFTLTLPLVAASQNRGALEKTPSQHLM